MKREKIDDHKKMKEHYDKKDGDDPRDTPPPTIFGEEIDESGHLSVDVQTVEKRSTNIKDEQINLEIRTIHSVINNCRYLYDT